MAAETDKAKRGVTDPDGACGPERAYANYLSIGHSLSEVLLDFGQFFPAADGPYFLSRLVTSPVHLRAFQQLLASAVENYEAEFGPLPAAPAPPLTQ